MISKQSKPSIPKAWEPDPEELGRWERAVEINAWDFEIGTWDFEPELEPEEG